jgi:hypothetical protein
VTGIRNLPDSIINVFPECIHRWEIQT